MFLLPVISKFLYIDGRIQQHMCIYETFLLLRRAQSLEGKLRSTCTVRFFSAHVIYVPTLPVHSTFAKVKPGMTTIWRMFTASKVFMLQMIQLQKAPST